MNVPRLDVNKMEELQRKVKECKEQNKKNGGGENKAEGRSNGNLRTLVKRCPTPCCHS